MFARRMVATLIAATVFSASAEAQQLIDGNDWTRASAEQRYAYVAGISDVISAGASYEQRHVPQTQVTFMRQAQTGLGSTTIEQAVQTVDAWYRANPGQTSKPVLSVMWREIAKPRLPQQGGQP